MGAILESLLELLPLVFYGFPMVPVQKRLLHKALSKLVVPAIAVSSIRASLAQLLKSCIDP